MAKEFEGYFFKFSYLHSIIALLSVDKRELEAILTDQREEFKQK